MIICPDPFVVDRHSQIGVTVRPISLAEFRGSMVRILPHTDPDQLAWDLDKYWDVHLESWYEKK